MTLSKFSVSMFIRYIIRIICCYKFSILWGLAGLPLNVNNIFRYHLSKLSSQKYENNFIKFHQIWFVVQKVDIAQWIMRESDKTLGYLIYLV